MAVALRRKILSNFKLQGLQLTNDATSTLLECLGPYSDSQHFLEIIDQIIEAVQKQDLKSPLVSREVVETAVEECNTETDSDSDKVLVVIDAFDIPSFAYNPDQRKFLSVSKASLKLHSSAASKAKLFRERFNLIYQRTVRHELFSPPVLGQAGQGTPKFNLRSVEYLLSSSGLDDKIIVLGMLVQLKEGKYHLEDLTGVVEMDLSRCVFQTGMFVESSIVLAEGVYNDDVFHVEGIGFPPIEAANETRSYFGSTNFFGGPSSVCANTSVKYQAMLEQQKEATIVFLSDIFLDDKRVLARLGELFTGYSVCPPVAFVLMGNFCSKPHGLDKTQRFKASFKELGNLILSHPALAEKSMFYIIPGPLDPGPGRVLPRPPLPSTLVSDVTDRIPNARMCTNPCRIQFCTREIVAFREDILNKVSRHCIRFPAEGTDMCRHFARSVLSQSHLCPLPIHSSPTYWSYDHSLRLYPLPDLILIGDKCDPYAVTMDSCHLANPGSFSRNGFEFKVYVPYTGQIDDSKLPD